MVVLVNAGPGTGAIDTDAARALARLGVTSVTLVRDDSHVGVVLDGWAFDPADAGENAAAIVAHGRGRVRTLRPLLHTAVCVDAARTGARLRAGSADVQPATERRES